MKGTELIKKKNEPSNFLKFGKKKKKRWQYSGEIQLWNSCCSGEIHKTVYIHIHVVMSDMQCREQGT